MRTKWIGRHLKPESLLNTPFGLTLGDWSLWKAWKAWKAWRKRGRVELSGGSKIRPGGGKVAVLRLRRTSRMLSSWGRFSLHPLMTYPRRVSAVLDAAGDLLLGNAFLVTPEVSFVWLGASLVTVSNFLSCGAAQGP